MDKKLKPVTPGNILLTEFLELLRMSQSKLALELHVRAARVNAIVNGNRRITSDMALSPGRFFKTGPELWVNLQARYDIKMAHRKLGEEIERRITPISDSLLERISA